MVVTAALTLAATLDVTLAVQAWREREAVLEEGRQSTRTLATALEQHASETFSSMNKVLSGVAEVIAARGASFRAADPEVRALLQRRLAYVRHVSSLFVVDAAGASLAGTYQRETVEVDLSDRPYFRAQADGTSGGLFVDGPYKSRITGNWLMVASRRLQEADGRFAGIVAASVSPETLASFYARADLGHGGAILLLTRDGTIAARHPDHARHIGASLADWRGFTRWRDARSGTGEDVSPVDGVLRLYSFQASTEHPLIVAVSLDKMALLERWRWNAAVQVMLGLIGTLAIAAAAFVIYRQLCRRLEAMQALEDSTAELSRALAAANAANETKLQFLANMSHELRTPLNAIIGFSDVMRTEVMGPLGSAHYRAYAADIHRSGEHLLSLINDILDVSRIEQGRFALREEACDLQDLIGDCLVQVEGRARDAGVVVERRIACDLPQLHADGKALRQIVLNLLSNAIKFTPRDGRVWIAISRTAAGEIAIEVGDTGIGIAAIDVARVFEPFQQVESAHTRKHDGVGLGLPLVKSLAEAHGARVDVDSAPGRGTVITVTFPAARTLQDPPTAPARPVTA